MPYRTRNGLAEGTLVFLFILNLAILAWLMSGCAAKAEAGDAETSRPIVFKVEGSRGNRLALTPYIPPVIVLKADELSQTYEAGEQIRCVIESRKRRFENLEEQGKKRRIESYGVLFHCGNDKFALDAIDFAAR